MKNNFYTKFKSKIKNTNYGFSQNFFYHLIAPLLIVVLGLILALCLNFNLGLDFKGGSVATVVVEQDINVSDNYKEVKKKLDGVLEKNKINGLIYQVAETNYYGNAITVKFNTISDELKETLRNDLITEFHPTASVSDAEIFVKVDNFSANVDSGVILSAALAIMVTIAVVMIYISARFGISAGFISLIMCLFDLIVLSALLAITRVSLEISFITGFALTCVYSLFCSLGLVSKINEISKMDKYSKATNAELVNVAVKECFRKNTIFAFFILVMALLIGVVPTSAVRSASLPVLLGVVTVYLSSMFITPGLWSRTYIKRKTKKAKEQKQVVVEEKIAEEDITKAPEVIVETEAKEEIK